MTEEIKVRLGKPEDVDRVLEEILFATKEMGIAPPSPKKVLAEIWPALNQHYGIIGIIEGPDGRLEGGILLRIGALWYSDQIVLEEKGIFVHPDYRSAKGGRAKKLCEFGKKTSDEMGIPLIMGVFSNDRTSGKIRLYERLFGEPAGAMFLYNGKTGNWTDNKAEAA